MANGYWTPQNDAELRKLVNAGLSAKQIAMEMEISRSKVLGYCHRNKIALAGRKTTEPMKDVKRSVYVPKEKPLRPAMSAIPSRSEKLGNNHFNVRRVIELSREPMTTPNWPKEPNAASVEFGDHEHLQCSMPLWSVNEYTGMVCGKQRLSTEKRGILVPISPYCAGCHQLAYIKR